MCEWGRGSTWTVDFDESHDAGLETATTLSCARYQPHLQDKKDTRFARSRRRRRRRRRRSVMDKGLASTAHDRGPHFLHCLGYTKTLARSYRVLDANVFFQF
jgi:hypothetical protein